MFIYLFAFFISCLFFLFGQKAIGIPFYARYTCYAIALLPCAIVAGLRDNTVGLDVLLYGENYFYTALSSSSFQNLIDRLGRAEPGYLFLNYLVSRFFSSSNWFYFFLSLLQMTFVFLGLNYWKDKFPLWLGMFVFYCFFFNNSMNMLRETLALSIVFFATTFIFKKKPALFYLTVCFATLFHYSAIISVSLYWFYVLLTKYKSKYVKISFVIFVLASIVLIENIFLLISPLFDYIFQAFLGFKVDSVYYFRYLQKVGDEKSSINIAQFAILSIIPALFFIFQKKFLEIEYNHYLFVISVIIIFTTQLHVIYGSGTSRIFKFLYWSTLLLFPQLPYIVKERQRTFIGVIVAFLCISFWLWNAKEWFWYGKTSFDGTMPYSSKYLYDFFYEDL